MPEPTDQRVAILTNSPAPYRDQLFRRLRTAVSQLEVCYTHPAGEDRAWVTDPVDDSGRLVVLLKFGKFGYLNRGVVGLVRRNDVVVVGGYDQPSYMVALLAAKILRKRSVVLFDGIAPSRLHRRRPLTPLKTAVVRLADVCLANGSVGRRYFTEFLRVPPERVHNQFLVPVALLPKEPGSGFDVLFVGRLIPQKGVAVLIEACRSLPGIRVGVVGEGSDAARLMSAAAGLQFTFLGEQPLERIYAEMRSAGCLALPSHDEAWGLVVHEALQVGTPVVVGVDIGCVEDLVVDGSNGVVVDTVTPAALARAIRSALELEPALLALTNSRVLEAWSLDQHVDAFIRAIDGRFIATAQTRVD